MATRRTELVWAALGTTVAGAAIGSAGVPIRAARQEARGMSLWAVLLLLVATFYGPVLYAAIGGIGVHLLGGLTQGSELGLHRCNPIAATRAH